MSFRERRRGCNIFMVRIISVFVSEKVWVNSARRKLPVDEDAMDMR